MNCAEANRWIHALVDGELDLPHSVEIEKHLAECQSCKATHDALLALRDTMRDPSLYFEIPTSLEARLAQTVAESNGAIAKPQAVRGWAFANLRWYAAGVASCAAVSLALWTLPNIRQPLDRQGEVASQEIIDSHLRSLQSGHLEDVVSTNQHTVKPWFNGKIGFSPPVNNLADKGFPLDGGRLDYLGSQPAAVLVYKANKHIINVYVTVPTGPLQTASGTLAVRGYRIQSWRSGDLAFDAVSDVNEQALKRFVALFKERDN